MNEVWSPCVTWFFTTMRKREDFWEVMWRDFQDLLLKLRNKVM